jgi:hypothetical protein
MGERYTNFEIVNGDLLISLTPHGMDAIEAAQSENQNIDSDDFMREFFEWETCNGWEWIAPEEIGALTNSPILSDCVDRDDQGLLARVGVVYWFPNYQIESAIQTLSVTGKVIFTGVPN